QRDPAVADDLDAGDDVLRLGPGAAYGNAALLDAVDAGGLAEGLDLRGDGRRLFAILGPHQRLVGLHQLRRRPAEGHHDVRRHALPGERLARLLDHAENTDQALGVIRRDVEGELDLL